LREVVSQFQTEFTRSGPKKAERGIALAPTTILRWVQQFVPEVEKRWNQYARSIGASRRCDETYIE
jgi:transposase-like protein